MAKALDECMQQAFGQKELNRRREVLEGNFSNAAGARALMKMAGLQVKQEVFVG
jgi:hypothetical protein